MSDTPEPLAAILAEMRRENRPYGISPDRLCSYADRIEAAAAREREENESWRIVAHGFALHSAMADERLNKLMQAAPGNAAAMREALERILDIEGYGAPWLEAKCIAQKALEGRQCTPPIAQETAKIEHPGNAAALRPAGRKTGSPKK